MFQKGGAGGDVLFRSVSLYSDVYTYRIDGGSYWYVSDSNALASCTYSLSSSRGHLYAHRDSNPGQPPGLPNDGAAYGPWLELQLAGAYNMGDNVHTSLVIVAGDEAATMCTQHGTWDGSTCSSCRDNLIGYLCTVSCGAHGTSDGSACVCNASYYGTLCTDGPYARQYMISGGGELDGTYSLVEAHCSGSFCDTGSPTTCGDNAPVFQRGGADGYVLFRTGKKATDLRGWSVGYSACLADCRSLHAMARRRSKPGQPPGVPDDDAAYEAWQQKHFNRWEDSPLAIVVGGGW